MDQQIVVAPKIEILMPGELEKLPEVLATLDKLASELDALYEEARKLVVNGVLPDKAARDRAAELNEERKRKVKDAVEAMSRHKKVVNDFKEQYILTPEKKVANSGERARGVLEPQMQSFDDAERRAAQAEKDRLRKAEEDRLRREAELNRQAEEKAAKERKDARVAEIRADLKDGKFGNPKSKVAKAKAEKLLREAGATEEADKVKAALAQEEANKNATVQAAQVDVKPNIENAGTVHYKAACFDADGFLSEYVRCCVTAPERAARMRAMIEVSDKALSAEARGKIKTREDDRNPAHVWTKEQFEKQFPFVKVEVDRSF